jgi:hypothetical protein
LATLEGMAARQGEDPIKALGRQGPELFHGAGTAHVYHGLGAQPPHERRRRAAGGGGEHVRPAALRELHRQCPHRAGRTEDEHGLAAAQLQRIVDALQGGETGHRARARLNQV